MQKNWSIWKSSCRVLARSAAIAALASALIVPQAAQACTSFVLPTTDGSIVYGRTMEFAFPIDSQMIVLPRNFEISATPADGKAAKTWKARYAAVGMNAFGVTALADGMNEKGLTGGVLYFPDFAAYTDPADAQADKSLAPWDFLTWALTNFATCMDARLVARRIFRKSLSV